MFQDPLAKQRHEMKGEGFDALVSSSAENVAYTAGYMVPSQSLPIRKRLFACVVTPEGPDAMLVVNVEENEARARSRIRDVRSYNEFTEDPMDLLGGTLQEFGLARGRIGLELDFLPARAFEQLRHRLPKARFEDAEKFFDRLRMVKTQEEIGRLRKVAQIVNRAHAGAYGQVHPGMTEMDLALRFYEGVLGGGADHLNKLVVGSGERSVFANCPPTRRILQEGDIVRVDVFANVGNYMSDVARTSVVGRATARQKELWKRLVEAETRALSLIRPGARTGEIFRSYLQDFARMGLEPSLNFLGHGIGLTLHENPYIDRYSDSPLEEGMVLAIEPLYFTGEMGFHLEDEVIVTAKGCELLSDGRNGGELIEIR